jgi:RecA/RadA recombinase
MAKKASEAVKEVLDGVQRDPSKRGALWISTGATLADIVVGAGRGLGYELGEVVLLESQSGAGKTYWGHEIVANAFHGYKKQYPGKFKHQYQDVESGSTIDSKKVFGFEIMPYDPAKRIRPKTIQDCYSESMLFIEGIKKDEYGVAIIDSINGLFDEKGEERAQERVDAYKRGKDYIEKSMGMELSKFLSQTFFKGICPAVEESNCLFVIIGQYRQKQLPSGGVYYDLQMGEALKYFANKRVKLTVAEDIVVKGRNIGAVVKVETKKARGHWPYRHAFVTMYFETGIDNVTSNVDFLYDLRTPEGKLSTSDKKQKVIWDMPPDEILAPLDKAGKEALLDQLAMTRQEMISYIENEGLEDELASRVIAKWNAEEAEALSVIAGRKKRFTE